MQTKNHYAAGHLSSYISLLRTNASYRRYWLASCISQIGDWFNYIAIFVLLNNLTGSGQAVSWFLIAKHLPPALFSPIAGVVADRHHRKAILIGCDLVRAAVVLCCLFIRRADQVWLIYLLSFLQESVGAFAHPARQASVPDLCTAKEELSLVNGLSGASWSVMLALGAAFGGFFTAKFGWQTAIVGDSLSFLLSAAIMTFVALPKKEQQHGRPNAVRLAGWEDMKEGAAYIKAHPQISALLLVKSGWALSGGVLVMLAVFGEKVFAAELASSGQGGGSGILFAMRGLGAAIGPILAWRLFGEAAATMRRAIGWAFFVSAAAYVLFSQAPNMRWAALWVCWGHIGGSVQWVFSTTLLHRSTEDRFRGRVFAAEMALLTLVLSLSTWLTGLAMDMGASPRTVVLTLALLFLLPGTGWLLYFAKTEPGRS
jgi:MFS family permease